MPSLAGIGCSDALAVAGVDRARRDQRRQWPVGELRTVVMESRDDCARWPMCHIDHEQLGQLAGGGAGSSSLPLGLGRRLWVWREFVGGYQVVMVGLVGVVSGTDPLIGRSVAGLRELTRGCAGADPLYVVAAGGQVPVELGGHRVDATRVAALAEQMTTQLRRSDTSGWYQESMTGDACRSAGKGASHAG